MTLKVRLTAMMGFLLMAVIALQFLLAEHERRSMEDRLSRLGSDVSRGTRQVVERARSFQWSLTDSTFDVSTPPPSARAESLLLRLHASGGDTLIEESNEVSTRVFVKRFTPHAPRLPKAAEPGAAFVMLEDSVRSGDGRAIVRKIERQLPSDSVEVIVKRFLGDAKLDSLHAFVFQLHPDDGGNATFLAAQSTSRPRTDVVVNLPLPLRGLDSMYAVEMRFPTDDLLADLARARRRSFALLAAMVGVGVVGALLMATQFTRPLRDLRASFQRVEQGDLSVALRPKRHDEIGQLTESFNHMVARLREQRGVEERLTEAERMAAIGRMAAGVAHEVRNPLNAIHLTLEQIREKSRGQDLDRYHDIVSAEITRLERLVSTFLELARAGDLERELHDASIGLNAAVELFRPEIEQKGAKLEATIEAPLMLLGDRFRLPNVWNNLLSNAAAMVPRGGFVRLHARRESHTEARANTGAPSPADLVVTLIDNGPGFTPEILPRIWEPFFSGRKDGTGLGLSIVRTVVEAHGGTVEAMNDAGGGARLVVRVPLVTNASL